MCNLPDNLSELDISIDKKLNPKKMSIYLTEMSKESIRINIRVQILFEETKYQYRDGMVRSECILELPCRINCMDL